MTVEAYLGRIADALEKIAEGGSVAATPPAKADKPKAADKKAEKPKKEEKDADVPTKDQVRRALQDYVAIEGKDPAIELLKEHGDGAENLSQLKEKFHAAVLKALT